MAKASTIKVTESAPAAPDYDQAAGNNEAVTEVVVPEPVETTETKFVKGDLKVSTTDEGVTLVTMP